MGPGQMGRFRFDLIKEMTPGQQKDLAISMILVPVSMALCFLLVWLCS